MRLPTVSPGVQAMAAGCAPYLYHVRVAPRSRSGSGSDSSVSAGIAPALHLRCRNWNQRLCRCPGRNSRVGQAAPAGRVRCSGRLRCPPLQGRGCSASPVRSLSASPFGAGAGGVQTVAGAGMGRGALPACRTVISCGWRSGGVLRLRRAHAEQRQADAEHEGTDKQAAAQRAQPWKFGKESVHAYRPPQGGDCPSCDVVLGRHFSIQSRRSQF